MQGHALHTSRSVTSTPSGPHLSTPERQQQRFARVACKAGNNGADARADVQKQREIARMLLTTQKNMLALNNSRVKVQEDLAVANRRIADLERELERLRAEQALYQQAVKQATLPPPFSADRGVSVAAIPSQAVAEAAAQVAQQQQQQPPQYAQQQQQQQQQQAAPPQQQPPPQQPAAATIHLSYTTGWHHAYVHFSVDGKPWTNAPGLRMKSDKQEHNLKTVTIEGSKLEFVMNNGDNDWDSPGRFSDKQKNYEINSPGTYRLKSGKVERIK